MAKKRSANQVPRHKGTVQVYRGRYSEHEYSTVKRAMVEKYVDGTYLKPSHIDDVMRYVAKKNWPRERASAWLAASVQPQSASIYEYLKMVDMAQAMLDSVHYGPEWIRFYEEVPGVPEAAIEYHSLAAALAVKEGKTIGPVPKIYELIEVDDVPVPA